MLCPELEEFYLKSLWNIWLKYCIKIFNVSFLFFSKYENCLMGLLYLVLLLFNLPFCKHVSLSIVVFKNTFLIASNIIGYIQKCDAFIVFDSFYDHKLNPYLHIWLYPQDKVHKVETLGLSVYIFYDTRYVWK